MEFNNPSEIVKDLSFGDAGKTKIMQGVDKLTNAVKSTLGASGKCVIYEDALGRPVITKDGVTVAESVVLFDPVENIGATLIKEAAKNTVKEAGDGTTTATVLAHSLLYNANKALESGEHTIRDIKNGIQTASEKVIKYISKHSKAVSGDQLSDVSSISCNNDRELGSVIASAYEKVGKDGVVLMEESDCLGEAVKAITDDKTTVLQVGDLGVAFNERIEDIQTKIQNESNPYFKRRLEQRLAMLNGAVGIVKVGADSKVELKEKKDRIEDAIYATKAAYKEGIVPGGGVALLNASTLTTAKNKGEEVLLKSIAAPYKTILENAGLNNVLQSTRKGWGIDVTSGKPVNMIRAGIIDPALVTKTALKNAVSVVSTIISADCVINNTRINESN